MFVSVCCTLTVACVVFFLYDGDYISSVLNSVDKSHLFSTALQRCFSCHLCHDGRDVR